MFRVNNLVCKAFLTYWIHQHIAKNKKITSEVNEQFTFLFKNREKMSQLVLGRSQKELGGGGSVSSKYAP